MNVEIIGKMYRTVVRPALVYGAETWALKKTQEKKLEFLFLEVDCCAKLKSLAG